MKTWYLGLVLVGLMLSVSVTDVEGQFGLFRGGRGFRGPGFRRGFVGGLLLGGLLGRRRFGGGFRGYPRFRRPGFFG